MSVTRFENKTKVADITPNIDDILNAIYPIGVIVCGAKPTVGTWEKVVGRFLLGSSSSHKAGSTGGEETHTLTSNEMPSHSHAPFGGENNFYPVFPTSSAGNIRFSAALSYPAAGNSFKFLGTNDFSDTNIANGTRATRTNNAGGGQAHNNMPPYLSVDMWRRTA